jgi:hypothetical protein
VLCARISRRPQARNSRATPFGSVHYRQLAGSDRLSGFIVLPCRVFPKLV